MLVQLNNDFFSISFFLLCWLVHSILQCLENSIVRRTFEQGSTPICELGFNRHVIGSNRRTALRLVEGLVFNDYVRDWRSVSGLLAGSQ